MSLSHPARLLLVLLCALLVTAQAGGVHLHYCPDDAQAVSVHAVDWQPHDCADADGHGFAAPHSDQVIFLGSEAPLKKPGIQIESPDPAGTTVPVFTLAAAVPATVVPVADGHIPVPRWYSLQPPARGPPR